MRPKQHVLPKQNNNKATFPTTPDMRDNGYFMKRACGEKIYQCRR